MQGFMAGWNLPGCLPDSEPAFFEDETGAIRYLSDTVERWWDEAYDSIPYKGEDDAHVVAREAQVDKIYSPVFSSLPYQAAPFTLECDGLVLWVVPVTFNRLND